MTKHDKESGRASLDITMLYDEDMGNYTAVAKSKAGQVSSTAPLLREGNDKQTKLVRTKGIVQIFLHRAFPRTGPVQCNAINRVC